MEHIVKLDKETQEQQQLLKQQLVNLISNKNLFLRQVVYDHLDGDEDSMTIKYIIADKIEVTEK